jgi:hypothetical protein
MAKRKLIGYIGVDSGQVMIGDPGYLDEFESAGFNPDLEVCDTEFSYQSACEASFADGGVIGRFPHLGNAGRGVVSFTRDGDGIFPVYQMVNAAGEVTGLLVDFK